jgi:hypothetical protein
VSEVLVLILGSGPSIAAYEAMLAAKGITNHNAVDQQQLTNLLNMALTAKAVHYLLDAPSIQSPIHEKRKR